MKKIILTFLLVFGVAGCSCNKEIYKFDSVIIEGKTYTCSKKDKEDEKVKTMCDNFKDMSIELKDEDTIVTNIPNFNMNGVEDEYKIENEYIYMKDAGEWMKFAIYNENSLTLEMTGVKVILKK